MKDWLQRLEQREQLSLLLLVLALVLYLLYMLAWAPLAAKREQLQLQNRAVAASLQRVDAMVAEVIQLRDDGAAARPRRNLTALINQSTGQRELRVSRLQPNSRGELQVRFENASFDVLLAWLHDMEYREGLLVREVSITQTGTSGRVNATVRLAQAG